MSATDIKKAFETGIRVGTIEERTRMMELIMNNLNKQEEKNGKNRYVGSIRK